MKWKTMRVVLRYCESNSGVILKPQWPLIFDLIDDPSEETDLIDKRLDGACGMRPAAMALGALAQSAAQYPHIKPGEEFTGYSTVDRGASMVD